MNNAFTEKSSKIILELTDMKPLSKGAFGAFEYGSVIKFSLGIKRELGTLAPVLHLIRDDDGESRSFPLYFDGLTSTELGVTDTYSHIIDTGKCFSREGLFYYHIAFFDIHGEEYISSDLLPLPTIGRKFQLTLFAKGFDTPHWFSEKAVYQIFPDRFCKTSDGALRDGAILNDDWYNAVPQYSQQRGGYIENNEFFGGTLKGIESKLELLCELGIGTLYLNPIFEAYSNHRYDTCDYFNIDPILGTNDDFSDLCTAAHSKGIRIILDGVFNHTGENSIYFDKYKKYGHGACSDDKSPYRAWYHFHHYPNDYECWWGIPILPRVKCDEPSYTDFICGENGVIRHWLRLGADGFRLDVADELSDAFIERVRIAAKAEKPDALILGEVWEDASDKISYGVRRKYLQGRELDSVMNYPLRSAITDYLKTGNCDELSRVQNGICRNYPRTVRDRLMNFLGTHDTPRILNILAHERPQTSSNEILARSRLTEADILRVLPLLRVGVALIAMLPGVPCVYYGDEIGMQGWDDPFNRYPYPWGNENKAVYQTVRRILKVRNEHSVFDGGEYRELYARYGIFAFLRSDADEALSVICNLGKSDIMSNTELYDHISGKSVTELKKDNVYLIDGAVYFDGDGNILKNNVFYHRKETKQ